MNTNATSKKPCYAKAVYDFAGHQVEELSLEEDDVVTLSVGLHVRGGWMYGEVNGNCGWFPTSYVKVLSDDEARAEGLALGADDAVILASTLLDATASSTPVLTVMPDAQNKRNSAGPSTAVCDARVSTSSLPPAIVSPSVQSPKPPVHLLRQRSGNEATYPPSNLFGTTDVKSWYSRYKSKAKKSPTDHLNTSKPIASAASLADSSDVFANATPVTSPIPGSTTSTASLASPVAERMRVSNVTRLTSLRKSTAELTTKDKPASSAMPNNAAPTAAMISIVGAPAAVKMTWADRVGEEAIAKLNLTKAEKQRQEVIYEAIQTERDYVNDLEIITEIYMKTLRKNKLLRPKDLSVIFSNIETILPMNQELLKLLEERQSQNHVVDTVGDIFIRVIDYMKMYTLYCSNYPYALVKLQALKHSKAVQKFLNQCQAMPECRLLPLSTYLIKPVQRICKYPLLLREIIKSTDPKSPDYELCQEALLKVETVVTIVNEGARQAEGVHRMLELQARFTTKQNIVAPNRTLVRTGMLELVSASGEGKKSHVFLFSDMLMVAKGVGSDGEKLKLVAAVPFDMILVTDLPDVESVAGTSPTGDSAKVNLIEICHIGVSKFTMAGTSPGDKSMWIRALTAAIDTHLNGRKNAAAFTNAVGITDRRLLNVLIPIQPLEEEPPQAGNNISAKTPKASIFDVNISPSSLALTPQSPGFLKLPALPTLRTGEFVHDVVMASGMQSTSPTSPVNLQNISPKAAATLGITDWIAASGSASCLKGTGRPSTETLPSSKDGPRTMEVPHLHYVVSTGNLSGTSHPHEAWQSITAATNARPAASTSRPVDQAPSGSADNNERQMSCMKSPGVSVVASGGRRSVVKETGVSYDTAHEESTSPEKKASGIQAPRKPPPARPTMSAQSVNETSAIDASKRVSSNPFIVQDACSRVANCISRSSTERLSSKTSRESGLNKGRRDTLNSTNTIADSGSKTSLRLSTSSMRQFLRNIGAAQENRGGSARASVDSRINHLASHLGGVTSTTHEVVRGANVINLQRMLSDNGFTTNPERGRPTTPPSAASLQHAQVVSPAVREWQSQLSDRMRHNAFAQPRPSAKSASVLPRGVAGYVASLESQFADRSEPSGKTTTDSKRSSLTKIDAAKPDTGAVKQLMKLNSVDAAGSATIMGAYKLNISKPIQMASVVEIIQITIGTKSKKEYIYVLQVIRGTSMMETTAATIRHTFDDFFDFHLHLLGHFPAESGFITPSNVTAVVGHVATKIIPDLPCQKIFVSYDTAKLRMPQLQAYMEAIIALPPKVSRSPLVLEFFKKDGKHALALMQNNI
ncbi:hypothetical protein SeMB42_g07856 [Synchytrium endobioticum]|uniref:DH domain-containing protein n=1 Tax=Synchytrium endobioticum TaxID=286115 RepID=A0A507BU67_9FUNG|nr:hypothetical protein SeMB42_g07856 [Synchytrium endobioticum]TPX36401.1 hypothetical protein SeLEV6574_g08067 [Synchytrium endobioticum]